MRTSRYSPTEIMLTRASGEQIIYDFHDVTEGSVLGVQDLFTHIGMARVADTCRLLALV